MLANALPDAVGAIRDLYVKTLADSIKQAGEVHVEPSLRSKSGDPLLEGSLQTPVRVDFLYKFGALAGKSGMVDTPHRLPLPQIISSIGDVALDIGSFQWDYASFTLHDARLDDLSNVRAWFLEAFDLEDRHPRGPDGLYNVVHFISDPENGVFTIDFGSAPTETFLAAIRAFASIGPRRISVG